MHQQPKQLPLSKRVIRDTSSEPPFKTLQQKPLPLSKRIIRDTSLEPPFKDDLGLARGAYRTWENLSMQTQ